jgi:dihydroxy-acid dehydratase
VSVLKGNIATESCLLKLGGKTLEKGEFKGPARVFNNEHAAMAAIQSGAIVAGDVVVVRYVGPVGEPGMPEMVALTVQLQGRGLGKDVALITDGRFSGISHGILIGHISPEAARGGPIAAVNEGDTIIINPVTRELNLEVESEELTRRMKLLELEPPGGNLNPNSVLRKYTRLVSSAHYGCVTGDLS